jgi:hypothetical protein
MPVQMIELEEVMMDETSDEALESTVVEVGAGYSYPNPLPHSTCT